MITLTPSGDNQYTFEDLVAIMAALRSEDGCPWDREQDHASIKNAVVEEAYELVEAINNKDNKNIREELGDLLLQVVFHSQLAHEYGTFNLADVIDGIASKLIYRHPHVFASTEVADAKEVLHNWDELKLKEKAITSVSQDIRQVPLALPAMIKSRKVQKKVAKVGFDFASTEDVLLKMDEELAELRLSLGLGDVDGVEEEFGDLLFNMVNLSRFLGLNPENTLTNALEKFITRFEGVENLAKASHKELSALSAEELDELWRTIKSTDNRDSDC